MKIARLVNKTLPKNWYFNPEKAHFFAGGNLLTQTETDRLLMNGDLCPGYEHEDLYLTTKSGIWIKRFSGQALPDLYLQILPDQAVEFLIRYGHIKDPDELDKFLKEHRSIEPGGEDVKKEIPAPVDHKVHPEYPSHFLQGPNEL